MTNKELIDNLRSQGVRILRRDGTTTEISEDFLEKSIEFLARIGEEKIAYCIVFPETDEEMLLAVWSCGCVKYGPVSEILSYIYQ